jgi:transcriptional regulator of met regulon
MSYQTSYGLRHSMQVSDVAWQKWLRIQKETLKMMRDERTSDFQVTQTTMLELLCDAFDHMLAGEPFDYTNWTPASMPKDQRQDFTDDPEKLKKQRWRAKRRHRILTKRIDKITEKETDCHDRREARKEDLRSRAPLRRWKDVVREQAEAAETKRPE